MFEIEGVLDAAGRGEFKFTKALKISDALRTSPMNKNMLGLRSGILVDGKLAIGQYPHAFAARPTAPPRVITFELKRKE